MRPRAAGVSAGRACPGESLPEGRGAPGTAAPNPARHWAKTD